MTVIGVGGRRAESHGKWAKGPSADSGKLEPGICARIRRDSFWDPQATGTRDNKGAVPREGPDNKHGGAHLWRHQGSVPPVKTQGRV